MNRSIKLIVYLIIVVFSLTKAGGQPVWISTGDYVTPSIMHDTERGYFFVARSTRLLPDGSIGQSIADISNIIVQTDKDLKTMHTINISMIGEWNVFLTKAFKVDPERILLTGIAYHNKHDEYRIGMIWMDSDLNLLRDTIIGVDNYYLNPHGWMIENQAGNLVTYGTLFVKDQPTINVTPFNYFFLVLDHEGSVLEFSEQVLEGSPIYVIPLADNKYHMLGTNKTNIQLNSDFTYDTTLVLNLPMDNVIMPIRLQPYNDNSYFVLVEYIVGAGPDYFDVDLAVFRVDSEAHILSTFAYGFADTTDWGTAVSYFHPDTLFVGGARKIEPFPADSNDFNHLFVHKTTISGEIVSTAFFGVSGQVNLGGLLATSDGGCIMSGTYYDFLTFPGSNITDAFFVKMDANGTITKLDESKLQLHPQKYLVYPIPAKNHLMIRSKDNFRTKASFFNANGVLITSLNFISNAEIDVSGFQSGIYFLQLIQQDGYSETKKLLIKN